MTSAHQPYGQLGQYDLDGDRLYGLFIRLSSRPVFVDIREDQWLEQRKEKATFLHQNTIELERSLESFLSSHPEFRARTMNSIGLHSKDLDRGEVFWDPTGTCLLKGLQFVTV